MIKIKDTNEEIKDTNEIMTFGENNAKIIPAKEESDEELIARAFMLAQKILANKDK